MGLSNASGDYLPGPHLFFCWLCWDVFSCLFSSRFLVPKSSKHIPKTYPKSMQIYRLRPSRKKFPNICIDTLKIFDVQSLGTLKIWPPSCESTIFTDLGDLKRYLKSFQRFFYHFKRIYLSFASKSFQRHLQITSKIIPKSYKNCVRDLSKNEFRK